MNIPSNEKRIHRFCILNIFFTEPLVLFKYLQIIIKDESDARRDIIKSAIIRKIDDHYGTLSKGQKAIADELIKKDKHFVYLNIEDLSSDLGVSTASLSRFIKKIGYENYSSFKRDMQADQQKDLDPSMKMKTFLSGFESDDDNIKSQILKDIDVMSSFMQSLDMESVKEAVLKISRAKSIVIAGLGISKSLVYFYDFRLQRMGIKTKCLINGGTEFIEALSTLTDEDLIIVISFKREYKEMVLSLKYARENGVESIALTENEQGNITKYADTVLHVTRGPDHALNSLSVPMSLSNALLLESASRRKEVIYEHMNKIKNLNEDYFKMEE